MMEMMMVGGGGEGGGGGTIMGRGADMPSPWHCPHGGRAGPIFQSTHESVSRDAPEINGLPVPVPEPHPGVVSWRGCMGNGLVVGLAGRGE